MVDLLNSTAGLGSLLVYGCQAGYRDSTEGWGGVRVSQCQADTTWSPVNISCVFDPAAVTTNLQGGALEYERGDSSQAFDLSTIVTIVSISVAIILSLIIIIFVIKHRKMRDKFLRARKFSKMTAGGVKVLPDYLFSPTPVDSQCKVSHSQEQRRSSASYREVNTHPSVQERPVSGLSSPVGPQNKSSHLTEVVTKLHVVDLNRVEQIHR